MRILHNLWSDLGRDEQGGTTVFGLFLALIFLIVGGIAIDTARLISERTKLQVAADSAAHAAMYYRQSMSEEEAIFRAVQVAQGTVPADRNRDAIRAEDVRFGYWDGSVFTPEVGATSAVQVNTGNSRARGTGVATYLLKLSGVSILDVEVNAVFASAGEGGCIYALDEGGAGVSLSGGTKISAPECAVLSNANVTTPCGTQITTARLIHEGEVNDCPWGENIVSVAEHDDEHDDGDGHSKRAPRDKRHSEDPLAGNGQVQALHARFADIRVANWPDPVVVSPGTDLNFGWSDLSSAEQQALSDNGCTVTHPQWTANWSVSCTATEINLGSINTGGGINVDFNTGGSAGTVYNFSGTISHGGGSKIRFGSGTFNIAGGVNGSDIRFGSGTFHIGTVENGCKYSICDNGEIAFEGSGTYIFDAGISVGGGSKLLLGDGAGDNSYIIGANNHGVSIDLSGSARVDFADATTVANGFRVRGEISGNGGGSCVVFPATENHDIAGPVNLSGAAILGAGAYHVDGTFQAGTGGASCGNSKAIEGLDVTLVISGWGSQILGGECEGSSFCVGGGNAVSLVAPTTGENAFLGVIGPLEYAGGAKISAGGSSRLSGVMYFPLGPIKMDGGATLSGSSSTDCLQIIGSEVVMDGGTAAASECVDLPGAGRMALVY